MIPATLKNRVEDLALMHGLPVDNLEAGVKEAVQVFNRFVGNLPDKLKTPTEFTKLLADNYEIVYSLLESASLAVGNENTTLRDEITELEIALSGAHRANIALVALVHRVHKTYAFQLSEGGYRDDIVDADGPLGFDDLGDEDEDEDTVHMPTWRVTVVLAGSLKDQKSYTRVTVHVTHATLAQLFPQAEVVAWDPDPWANGEQDEVRGFKSSAAPDDLPDDTPL